MIDTNLTNVEAFETAGKELLGEWSCVPMIAFHKAKKSQAFKLLAKARGIPFAVSNEISTQITFYEEAKKRAIEQHPDDNEYDVDEDIHIEDYVESQYLQLVDEAKQYENIVLTASEHPCAHLTYNTDLREDIGIIRMKPRPGSKDPEYVLFMDGVTADKLNYVKSDMLRVDVVKVIADTFKLAGRQMLSVNELLKAIKEDKRIFQLYGDGVTIGVNQLEGAGTTAKCKQFKPKTIVEATQLVGAIRPGARSFVDKFISRTPFSYGIKSLDELLRMPGTTGNTATSSFILFDEQILLILMAAGFDGGHAYQVIKSIKKKKIEKVLAAKEEFAIGYAQYLKQHEGADDSQAKEVVEKVWRVIEDAASYLFCSAHAYAYALDGAYCAYLKVNYPYEFYFTLLQLYTEKGNRDKIAAIVNEMKSYAGIDFSMGRFGDDNTKWQIDKTNHRIVQALSSVKFISAAAARKLRENYAEFSSFTRLYDRFKDVPEINTRQMKALICLNYFEEYGSVDKLLAVMNGYENGVPNVVGKISKTLKSRAARVAALELWELGLSVPDMSCGKRLSYEYALTNFCFSKFPDAGRQYYIESIDDKYSIKIHLYRCKSGARGICRMTKPQYAASSIKPDSVIEVLDGEWKPKYSFKNGKPTPIGDEKEYWIKSYRIIEADIQAAESKENGN